MTLTQVSSAGIKNAEVKTEDILDANITTAKVADNAVTGAKVADNLDIPDSNKIRFGTGNDLQIYHDGTDSTITNSTNDLFILCTGDDINIKAADDIRLKPQGDEDGIAIIGNGAIELYHNNAKVVETKADGLKVKRPSGGATYLEIHGCEGQDAVLYLAADDADDDADEWIIVSSTDGSLYFQNNTSSSWETNIKTTGNGNVELYYDNSKKLETTSIGATATGTLFQIDESGGSSADGSRLDLRFGNNNTTDVISSITFSNTVGEAARIQAETSGANNSGLIAFYTDNAGTSAERMRINPSGSVGIGGSPDRNLTLYSAATTRFNLKSANDSTVGIEFGDPDDINIGYIVYDNTDNSIQIGANAGERLRIDSSGRVLIGTTTEGEVTADELTVAGSGNAGITIRSGTTNTGNIFFSDSTSGVDEYRGYVQYKQGEEWMALGTNGATRLRVDADGLKFGSDTAAANALDDYEEGTWTPTINANLTLNGDYDVWSYTKIGRLVTIRGIFVPSSWSGSNNIFCSLPFVSNNDTESANAGGQGCMFRYIDGCTGGLSTHIGDNSSYFYFYRCESGNSAYNQLSNDNLNTDCNVHFCHTYATSA